MFKQDKRPEETVLEACMIVGFLAVVGGIAAIYWPAALISGGAMLLWYAYPRRPKGGG